MIVYDSFYFFSQVVAYMNFAVQVFKWTACPCLRRPPLPRAPMYEKRPSPSRNQSNTVRNESLKEDLCFGSYFRFVNTKAGLPAANSTFQRKARMRRGRNTPPV